MSLKRTITFNTSINLIGYGYVLLSSLISIPHILSNLGKDLFGILLLVSVPVTLSSAFDLGIANAAIRYFSLNKTTEEDQQKIWQTSFSIYLITALANSLLLPAIFFAILNSSQLFMGVDKSIYLPLTLIVSLNIFVNLLGIHHQFLSQAKRNFVFYNLRLLIIATGNTFATAFVTQYTNNLFLIVATQCLFYLLATVVLALSSLAHFGLSQYLPKYDRGWGRQLLSFGLKNNIGKVVTQGEVQLSKYVIGFLSSASVVAVFAIPQQIINKVAGVVSQFSLVVFPVSTSMLTKNRINQLRKVVNLSQIFLLLSGLIGVVVIHQYGYQILLWWLNNKEVATDCYPLLKIMSFYFLLTILTPVPSVVFDAMNLPQLPSFFATLTVLAEFIAFLFLVPAYGALGAATSLLFGSLISVPPFIFVFYSKFYAYKPKE